jgi:hypothetical protein
MSFVKDPWSFMRTYGNRIEYHGGFKILMCASLASKYNAKELRVYDLAPIVF